MRSIEIDGRKIGLNYPPYVIAELSANHNGDINRAFASIEAAAAAGVDAVKIQSYTADTITIDCRSEDFMIRGGLWDGYNLYDLYKQAETPFEWHEPLFAKAREVGITLFSTPFDDTAVDLLESLDVPAYKIASFELIDLPLIQRVARTEKPLIMSTGMADEMEIREAVETARQNGCEELVLLHCISSYPAPVEHSNLRTIKDMAERFGVIAGLSDHSLGTVVAVSSVALGACVIEKHFMLDNEEGPDSAFSLTPDQLVQLKVDTDKAWRSLGKVSYDRSAAEANSVLHRRSLYFVRDLRAGEVVSPESVKSIRPGYGLAPKFIDDVRGKIVTSDVKSGTPVSRDLLSTGE